METRRPRRVWTYATRASRLHGISGIQSPKNGMFPQNSSANGLWQRAETQAPVSASAAPTTFPVDDNRLSCDPSALLDVPEVPALPRTADQKAGRPTARLIIRGKPKNYTDEERTLRRERMREINARRNGPTPTLQCNTAISRIKVSPWPRSMTLSRVAGATLGNRSRSPWPGSRIRAKVLRVCAAHVADPYAQRYHFWNNYATSSRFLNGTASLVRRPPPGNLSDAVLVGGTAIAIHAGIGSPSTPITF